MSDKIKAAQHCLNANGLSTQREWRQLKRQHLCDLRQAFEAFRLGCAYVPGYPKHIRQIEQHLEELHTLMSPKEWGP